MPITGSNKVTVYRARKVIPLMIEKFDDGTWRISGHPETLVLSADPNFMEPITAHGDDYQETLVEFLNACVEAEKLFL